MNKPENITKDYVFSRISIKDNAELIYTFLVSNHKSKLARKLKLLGTFDVMHKQGIISKPLSECTSEDIHATVSFIDQLHNYQVFGRTRTYSEATKTDYKKIIRQFYNWYKHEDSRLTYNSNEVLLLYEDERERTKKLLEYEKNKQIATKMYQAVAQIHINNKTQVKKKSRADILQIEDYHLLIRSTQSPFMRAMISVLFFTGIRIGAIHKLKIKDIDMSSDVWRLSLHDKGDTRRTIPAIEIKKPIIEFLERYHPNPVPDAYLWTSNNSKNKGNLIKRSSIVNGLRAVKRQARVYNPSWNKPVNPHWFRHSWATRNKNVYNDHTLKRLGGWCMDSKAINNYNHLNDDDIIDEFSRVNGVAVKQKNPTSWTCHTCTSTNLLSDRYCRCGAAQSSLIIEEDQRELQETKKQINRWFNKILQDKELLQRFQEFSQQ